MPKLQAKRLCAVHWFEPFGSVQYQDLCSKPVIMNSYNVSRYVFWDQEPLQQHLFSKFADQFLTNFFKGPRHLIVSEINSDDVDSLCNTYGFTPHYYFFHGWAALDWYRGYNRSFLIKPASDRIISHSIMSPNRIIGGQRQHRVELMYHLLKNNVSNGLISFPARCPVEGTEPHHMIDYPDAPDVFQAAELPLNFDNETDHPMHSCWLSLFEESAKSLCMVVTETVFRGRRHHLTEKTFKPIAMAMPFILVSTAGSLKYLRSYGFQTFDGIWNEDYDLEIDDDKRMKKIVKLIVELDQMGAAQRQDLFTKALPIVEHNYQHFYNGGFEQILWHELTNMLDKM